MRIKIYKISDLKAAEYNPRFLSLKQEQDLDESLKKFGMVDPIIVNVNPDRKNVVVGGHQRIKRWVALGNDKIECVEVNLNLADEKELNIRLNRNTGEFDWKTLAKEFDQFQLILWGFKKSDFPKLPPMVEVKTHKRSLVPTAVKLEIYCNNPQEATELKSELKGRGYEVKTIK